MGAGQSVIEDYALAPHRQRRRYCNILDSDWQVHVRAVFPRDGEGFRFTKVELLARGKHVFTLPKDRMVRILCDKFNSQWGFTRLALWWHVVLMPPQCHKMFEVISSAPQRTSVSSCTGHSCCQSSPVYCLGEPWGVFILLPSLCPSPGCSLVWYVVSSSGSWSPSPMFYWCLYAGGCIHTS